jgi:hypothetical protein
VLSESPITTIRAAAGGAVLVADGVGVGVGVGCLESDAWPSNWDALGAAAAAARDRAPIPVSTKRLRTFRRKRGFKRLTLRT